MEKKLSLTIGIPMYNHAGTISTTLDSIFVQMPEIADLVDLEVLVVDNCSTDNSSDIVRNFCIKYPETLKYHKNEKNIGMQRNFNRVFEVATKEYVWLLGDDKLCPDSIKYLLSVFHNSSLKPMVLMAKVKMVSNISKDDGIALYTPAVSGQNFFCQDVYDLVILKKQSCLILSSISATIINRAEWLSYSDLVDYDDNLYPHYEIGCRIVQHKPIVLIDKILVVVTASSATSRGVNGDYHVKAAGQCALIVKNVFGNYDILTDQDKAAIIREVTGSFNTNYRAVKNPKQFIADIIEIDFFFLFLSKNDRLLLLIFNIISSMLPPKMLNLLLMKFLMKRVLKAALKNYARYE